MELFARIIVQWFLLYLISTEERPASLSSNTPSRKYNLQELEELMQELQRHGVVTTAAGSEALEPVVAALADSGRSRNGRGGQEQRIKNKLSKLERAFRKAYGNPGSSRSFSL